MKKVIHFVLIVFFLFNTSKVFSNINNSILISVGNLPITHLDLVKEMQLISMLTNNKIDNSNKEQIKSIAVQSLIKRKIKEIEIKKFNIQNYNKRDIERLIVSASTNIGTDENGLKELFRKNNLNFEILKERFRIDLKWNTLIFELYKNKIVLNTSEVEEKINTEIEKIKEKRTFLLSEIEINKLPDGNDSNLNKIFDSIKKEGFEKTAKKFSISKSAEYGGNIGWIDKEKLSKKIYEKIKNLKTDEVSKAMHFDNTIVIIKKVGEKIFERDIEKIKNTIIRAEKEKKLQMFSKAHFANLERTIQVNFL